MVIEMDGRELTRLHQGRTWVSDVDPGRHVLRVGNWWPRCPPMELVLAPGDDVRLEARLRGLEAGFWAWGTPLLVRTDAATPDPQVLGVTETHRSAESIGTDNLRIDNTLGVGQLTRTIRVAREWSRMVSLDQHASDDVSIGGVVGPNWLALKASIERSLEQTYAISVSRREEFAEEIGVEVKPGADVTVTLAWKRIWQHGVANVLTDGRQAEVEFRMAVGVTFDQSTAGPVRP